MFSAGLIEHTSSSMKGSDEGNLNFSCPAQEGKRHLRTPCQQSYLPPWTQNTSTAVMPFGLRHCPVACCMSLKVFLYRSTSKAAEAFGGLEGYLFIFFCTNKDIKVKRVNFPGLHNAPDPYVEWILNVRNLESIAGTLGKLLSLFHKAKYLYCPMQPWWNSLLCLMTKW